MQDEALHAQPSRLLSSKLLLSIHTIASLEVIIVLRRRRLRLRLRRGLGLLLRGVSGLDGLAALGADNLLELVVPSVADVFLLGGEEEGAAVRVLLVRRDQLELVRL